MGSNASTGLGGDANHGTVDVRLAETSREVERPTEDPEDTNRKSRLLLPVSQKPYNNSDCGFGLGLRTPNLGEGEAVKGRGW